MQIAKRLMANGDWERSICSVIFSTVSRSVGQSVSRSVGQSVSRSVGQSVSRSVGHPFNRSLSRKQLSLDLEFTLGDEVPVNKLVPGKRFIRDGKEGQVVRVSEGSATVKVLKEDGKWEKIQWSPSTVVQELRA